MKKRFIFTLLVIFMLIACNQVVPVADVTSDYQISEFVFTPDGLDPSAVTSPKLFVSLGIVSLNSTTRIGKVGFRWTDTTSTLSGTASLRLRRAGRTTTLVKSPNHVLSSNGSSVVISTPSTMVTGGLCLEVLRWNLSTSSGYSFNTQTFPITFCVSNKSEMGSDVAVSLDGQSATTVFVNETFPFVIATQNLGVRPASGVVVDIALPSQLEFVEDTSVAYNCTEVSTGNVRCVLTGDLKPGRRSLPLILKGKTPIASTNINVSIGTTSTDSSLANNSFVQAVVVRFCEVILVPDIDLLNKIKVRLGIANDASLCKDDMLSLTSFGSVDYDISDLTGLEYATNLDWLHLNSNQISDISPLAGLTNLTNLDLGYNQISDISPLAGLTKLTDLYLAYNQITDISALISNSGINAGDKVNLRGNLLDLTSGSDDMNNIAILQARGIRLFY